MTLPNKLTIFRIILTPFFFVVFFIPEWFGCCQIVSLVFVWLIGTVNEITDLLDGYYARKYNQVTDIGKILDPFADVISRVTYFLCFAAVGIMPFWILLIILYREFSISFLRILMIKEGVAMAASVWGKLKAVTYVTAAISGMILITLKRLELFSDYIHIFQLIVLIIFIIAAAASIASFFTYVFAVYKYKKK